MISMPTIMSGNMDIELPAIYIIKRFIGTCFRGPSAKSQDLLIIIWLELESLLWSALWTSAAPWVYPGGCAISTLFSCLFL